MIPRMKLMATSWMMVTMAGCAGGMAYSSDPETGTSSVTVGVGAEGGTPQESLDRSRVPEVGEPPALELPEVQDHALENGLRVVLVERHALPVVSLQLQFRGGASAHSAAQAGLAAFTADLVDEGTETRSSLEIADGIDLLGATMSSVAGYDASQLSLSVLRTRFPDALAILADVVMNPSFPEAEVDRIRRERLARVLQRKDEPGALADDAFAYLLYGADHPYGQPLIGTESSLSALTVEDVRAFHGARYAPGQGTLVVVGDVTREDLDGLLADAFAGWSGAGEDPPVLPAPSPAATERTIFLVDKPGAAQSEVRVGRVALDRSTEAYHRVMVANTVLGGSFTSRLNSNLREDKGYTYGARSYFDLRRQAGPFEASAAVATPVTDASVREFLLELDRLAAEPVPAPELAQAANYLARRLPQRFESVDDVVARLAELTLYDVPLDFYEGYVDGVLAVDPEDVRAVAREELGTDGMVIVIAGDRATIEEPLKALGVAPVRVHPETPIS